MESRSATVWKRMFSNIRRLRIKSKSQTAMIFELHYTNDCGLPTHDHKSAQACRERHSEQQVSKPVLQSLVYRVLELEDHGSLRLRFDSELPEIENTVQTVADRDSIVRIEFSPHRESNGRDGELEKKGGDDRMMALSKEERIELVLLSGREGWSYRKIAEEFNLRHPYSEIRNQYTIAVRNRFEQLQNGNEKQPQHSFVTFHREVAKEVILTKARTNKCIDCDDQEIINKRKHPKEAAQAKLIHSSPSNEADSKKLQKELLSLYQSQQQCYI
ncbi:Hypothetical predicted protein [Octopus vulgaris]|uniref:Uncharacterized protein n=1 Tax=Octopus vulgaris TaxID=6645 RepID=A0AA36FDF9_OCTVU|nr:Hypothetical predicted protein [Octopus vulgaris]